MSKKKITPDDKKLIKRYLIWCYKTTKESLERIDRKVTQVLIDEFVLKQIQAEPTSQQYLNKIKEFEIYIKNKERALGKEKFLKNTDALNPEYLYLKNRLNAIKMAISKFLGKAELQRIERLYQDEMTKRILEAREH